MHAFWRAHRTLSRLTGGRFLWTPASKRGWGAMRLTTVGRRTGRDRTVIVGYLEDGDELAVLAMNGWEEGDPDWWRNLEVDPTAVVQLSHGRPRRAHARRATGDELRRLWARWGEVDNGLDDYAARRSSETPVVVFTLLDEVG